MADLDTLNSTLDGIASDASEVATEHGALVQELQQLQQQIAANQPVDLTGAIAKATAIKATLDGIVTAASSASSGATPTPTPSS
jgi:prefoldin subunit 5